MKFTEYLLKHSLVYGLGEALIRITSFLLIPVYTRFLVPSEYGILQLLVITSNLTAMIFELGMGSAIFKSIIYNDNSDRKTVFSSAFIFVIISSFAGIVPFVIFSGFVSNLVAGSPDYKLAFIIIMASVFFRSFSIIPLAKLRIDDRSITYVTVAVIRFVLHFALNILFVVVLDYGILGTAYAYLITAFVMSFPFVFLIRDDLKLAISPLILKDMLGYGLPLVPGAIAMFVINMSNRYLLKQYSSAEQVALFSIGFYVAFVINIVVYAFQRVWASAMFKIAREEDAREIFALNFTYFITVLLFICFFLSVFSREIIALLATDFYASSHRVVPLICLSYLFYGVYYYLSYGMNVKKKTIYQPVIIGIAACLNVFLNIMLIPKYGMMGAAANSLLTFCLIGCAAGFVSNRFYGVHIEWGRVGAVSVLVAAGYGIQYFVFHSGAVTVSSWLKPVFVLGFLFVCYQLPVFSRGEKSALTGKIKSLNPRWRAA